MVFATQITCPCTKYIARKNIYILPMSDGALPIKVLERIPSIFWWIDAVSSGLGKFTDIYIHGRSEDEIFILENVNRTGSQKPESNIYIFEICYFNLCSIICFFKWKMSCVIQWTMLLVTAVSKVRIYELFSGDKGALHECRPVEAWGVWQAQ